MTSMQSRVQEQLKDLGRKIVTQRQRLKIKQNKLAEMTRRSVAQICKLEHGEHLPRPEFLLDIEDALGMPPMSLVGIRNQIAQDACHDDNAVFNDPFVRFKPIRENHTVSDADLKKLTAEIAPTVDRYARALKRLGMITFCQMNLGPERVSSSQNGIDCAEALRQFIGDHTAYLAALLPRLEQLNLRFIPVPTLPPCVHKDGRLSRRHVFTFFDQRYDTPVFVVNMESAPYSQLYHIAYEIGAYIRYRRLEVLSNKPRTDESWFCRAFASVLMFPTEVSFDLIDSLHVPKGKWTPLLLDAVAYRFGASALALVWRLKIMSEIDSDMAKRLERQLLQPHACDDETIFMPRPPIVYGTWLRTLEARVKATLR